MSFWKSQKRILFWAVHASEMLLLPQEQLSAPHATGTGGGKPQLSRLSGWENSAWHLGLAGVPREDGAVVTCRVPLLIAGPPVGWLPCALVVFFPFISQTIHLHLVCFGGKPKPIAYLRS